MIKNTVAEFLRAINGLTQKKTSHPIDRPLFAKIFHAGLFPLALSVEDFIIVDAR